MLEPGDINVKNTWRLFKLAVSWRDKGWGGLVLGGRLLNKVLYGEAPP